MSVILLIFYITYINFILYEKANEVGQKYMFQLTSVVYACRYMNRTEACVDFLIIEVPVSCAV